MSKAIVLQLYRAEMQHVYIALKLYLKCNELAGIKNEGDSTIEEECSHLLSVLNNKLDVVGNREEIREYYQSAVNEILNKMNINHEKAI